jgi:hypothetical protein
MRGLAYIWLVVVITFAAACWYMDSVINGEILQVCSSEQVQNR